MNLADIDMLFGNVVPQPLWGKIRHADHAQELGDTWANVAAADARQIGGAKPEPLVTELPGRIIDYMKTIMPAMRVNPYGIDCDTIFVEPWKSSEAVEMQACYLH
ncbi:hypothetical protein NDU88_004711 [Pleurodeles waltl]|uniref:Uncharacterized protein n=1 Tax=Pleurodeles waltl TaxID=8319 RepID=A0AAV7M7V4_PLEWA|nr:hypothetical protein NDU88_004711 [Pleurodeles waltl]